MAEAKVSLLVQLKDQVSKQMGKMKASFVKNANAMKGSALIFGAGFAAITAGVALSVNAYKEQQRVDAELQTRLESTGYAAGMTAEEVKKLASELQKTTGVSDEVTQSAQNMLLSFTGIGKEVFPATTEAALDMTAAMNGGKITQEGLKASSIMLGKALNDPIKGISALSRTGVVFTDQQKEMITTLAESGDTIGAQKIMLAELKNEFGGTASNLDTLVGAQRASSAAFGDMLEVVGKQFEPIILKASIVIKDLSNWIAGIIPKIQDFIVPLTILVGTFTGLMAIGGAIVTLGPMIALAFAAITGPIGLTILAISGIVAAFTYFKNSNSGLAVSVRAIWGSIGTIFTEYAGAIVDTVKGLGDVLGNFGKAMKAVLTGDFAGAKEYFGKMKTGAANIGQGFVDANTTIAAELQKRKAIEQAAIDAEAAQQDEKAVKDAARAQAAIDLSNEQKSVDNETKLELDQNFIDSEAEMNAIAEEARQEFEKQKTDYDKLTADERTKLLIDTLGKERIARDAQKVAELKANGKHEEAKEVMNKMYKDAFVKINKDTIDKVDKAQHKHWDALKAGDKLSKDDREKIMSDLQIGFKSIIGLMGKDSMAAFRMQQGMAIGEAIMNTYKAANAAYAALAGIPIVGPVLGAVAAAGAVVSGIANVNEIRKQTPPKMEVGGRVLTEGLAHLHPAEVILNKKEAENYTGSKELHAHIYLGDEELTTMVVQLNEKEDEMLEAGVL